MFQKGIEQQLATNDSSQVYKYWGQLHQQRRAHAARTAAAATIQVETVHGYLGFRQPSVNSELKD